MVESKKRKPRTRATRLPRKFIRCKTTVGKDKMPLTCPRCGWPCTHLVVPYHESEWIEHGGFCAECCNEAAARYDQIGWPDYREDHDFYMAPGFDRRAVEQEPEAEPPPPSLFDTFEGAEMEQKEE
jgi:hypothetical protein